MIERLTSGWYQHGNVALVVGECNSMEYHTKRFEEENRGESIGWNRAVVDGYRENFTVADLSL